MKAIEIKPNINRLLKLLIGVLLIVPLLYLTHNIDNQELHISIKIIVPVGGLFLVMFIIEHFDLLYSKKAILQINNDYIQFIFKNGQIKNFKYETIKWIEYNCDKTFGRFFLLITTKNNKTYKYFTGNSLIRFGFSKIKPVKKTYMEFLKLEQNSENFKKSITYESRSNLEKYFKMGY